MLCVEEHVRVVQDILCVLNTFAVLICAKKFAARIRMMVGAEHTQAMRKKTNFVSSAAKKKGEGEKNIFFWVSLSSFKAFYGIVTHITDFTRRRFTNDNGSHVGLTGEFFARDARSRAFIAERHSAVDCGAPQEVRALAGTRYDHWVVVLGTVVARYAPRRTKGSYTKNPLACTNVVLFWTGYGNLAHVAHFFAKRFSVLCHITFKRTKALHVVTFQVQNHLARNVVSQVGRVGLVHCPQEKKIRKKNKK